MEDTMAGLISGIALNSFLIAYKLKNNNKS
jgi:hypothetical protein